MKKKLICSLLAILMIFSSVAVSATKSKTSKIVTRGYLPGETERVISASDCIATDNANVQSDGIQINAGGSATWGFFTPYAVRSVKFVYEGSGDVEFSTESNTYNTITLSGSGEDTIVFSENLGYKTQYRQWPNVSTAFEQDYVEHPGEKEVTVKANSGIKIKQLIFEKELTSKPRDNDLPNVSPFVMETISTTIMHVNSSVIVVNGGRRYINNNDVYEKPVHINGSLYLPIETLAKALGYYHEDIPEENFALMRSEWHEVIKYGDKITVAEGTAKAVPAPSNVIVRHNGKTYAQVRYFGELTGETVGYKNGLIVIDDKYTVKNVLENAGYYQSAYNLVAPFIKEKTGGKTYYVAKTASASDKNSGSYFAPFKTLEKAASVASAGDTVIVREGVYRETLAPKNNGMAGAPITFKAAEGENVVISAADKLGHPYLANKEKGEYIVGMPMDLGIGKNQVFINNESMMEARYPDAPLVAENAGLSNLWVVQGDIHKKPGDRLTFVSDNILDQPDDYWVGGTYVGVFGYAYGMSAGLIDSSTKGSFTVSNQYKEQHYWEGNIQAAANNQCGQEYGMIVGHINALNMPEEWVRTDDGMLHIILPEGADAKTVQIEAKARQLVIDLTDKKFVNIEGFKTIGGSVTTGDNSEMCMLNGLDMKYINHYTLTADARNGYIDVAPEPTRNTDRGRYYENRQPGAPQRGDIGIYFGGTDDIIVNTKMDQAAGCALYLTGTYTYIDNNLINQCGYMGSYASAIHADQLVYEDKCAPRGGFAMYNNTIQTCTQSAIDFCSAELHVNDNLNVPWLPSDIAYNDIHDTNLTSDDAGSIYANGLNAGWDKQMSTVRYNYVYQTIDAEDGWSGDMGIYWDGQSFGFNTHNNLIFAAGTGMINIPINNQGTIPSEAYMRDWDNAVLHHIDLDKSKPVADAIGDEFFSENRPFFAGTKLGRSGAYTNNLDRVKQNKDGIDYPAYNAELSEGVKLDAETGYVDFTEDGQYIHFKDVDFGDGSNEMLINIFFDSNYSYDEIDIFIGESMENYRRKMSVTAPQHESREWYPNDPPNRTYTCSIRKDFDMVSGVNDVWIKVNEYYSVAIGGISVYEHSSAENNFSDLDKFALHLYFDDSDELKKNTEKYTEPPFTMAYHNSTETPGIYALRSTWAGWTARYTRREVTEKLTKDGSYLVVAAGSGSGFEGQLMNVYLTEPSDTYQKPTGEPVAQFREVNAGYGWDYMEPIAVPILEDIEPGVYDVYLELVYEDHHESPKTSNALYFGFLKDGVDTSQYTTFQAPRSATTYDKEISTQREDRPFVWVATNTYIGALDRVILNTLPGTTAGYKNVINTKTTSKFAVEYALGDISYAGQPVTVRVADADGKVISTGKFETEAVEYGKFKITTCNLSTPVPEGKYTVYLDFGGDKNSEKSCRLCTIGFTE